MVWSAEKKCLAFSGGIGGAKLALGLARCLEPEQLSIVANTGDDFVHWGLKISPDLDTVMYTLAGLNNQAQGWGLAGESWNFLEALRKLEGETWFQLGDRDLATHLTRTHLLAEGKSLTEATRHLCQKLGVRPAVFPMSDVPVPTWIKTNTGQWLPFQHYFVKERCEPGVCGFRFQGMEEATASPMFLEALRDPKLAAIVLCPSNPFISIDPILALPGIRQALQETPVPVVAVSPIVGDEAIKGPTAKMMKELGLPSTAWAVADYYQDFLDGFVLDTQDQAQTQKIQDLGIATQVTQTVMHSLEDRIHLAHQTLMLADQLLEN